MHVPLIMLFLSEVNNTEPVYCSEIIKSIWRLHWIMLSFLSFPLWRKSLGSINVVHYLFFYWNFQYAECSHWPGCELKLIKIYQVVNFYIIFITYLQPFQLIFESRDLNAEFTIKSYLILKEHKSVRLLLTGCSLCWVSIII